ncbi:MAG: hypothetical protein WB793_11610 [Candidatus Dormiibacterota bacterium]
MGRYSPNADWAVHHPEAPALSLIVAVDTVDEGARRSIDHMLKVVGESSCEVIVAAREIWPDAPPELTVVSCTSDSRGVRFDRAASRAKGRVLAFLDDRVYLPDGWPQRVIEFFDDPAVAIAGGPVLPRSWSRAERVSALLLKGHLGMPPAASISTADKPRIVAELTDSNVLIRNDVFRRVGGFRTPHAGGETLRLCHNVRMLLGCTINYEPDLAVFARTRAFPGPFLAETAASGRARGDIARRSPEVAPFRRYALPTLVTLVVLLEVGLLIPFPHHPYKAALVGGALLFVLYLTQAGRVALGKGPARIGDRVLAALGVPLVTVTYGVAFVRGFFDTGWRL